SAPTRMPRGQCWRAPAWRPRRERAWRIAVAWSRSAILQPGLGICRGLSSGHEDQVARILQPVRRAIEIRIDLLHREAGPRQKVLGLETIDAAHLESVDETFLATVGVGDVIDEL